MISRSGAHKTLPVIRSLWATPPHAWYAGPRDLGRATSRQFPSPPEETRLGAAPRWSRPAEPTGILPETISGGRHDPRPSGPTKLEKASGNNRLPGNLSCHKVLI